MDLHLLEDMVASGGPTPDQYPILDQRLEDLARLTDAAASQAAERVRTVLKPALTRRTMQGFALLKPHGYPGDYEIIDRIYQRWVSPDPGLRRWDEYFHRHAAPQAVRNRCSYFGTLIEKLNGVPGSILNVASGPGRDLLTVLEAVPTAHHFTCLDIDTNALAHASQLCHRFASRVEYRQGNVLRLRDRQEHDLVWSAGLFDYFSDRVFVAALRRLLAAARPGGQCVVGNFGTSNPSRPYMELVGDWHLHHRSPEDLRALAVKAGAAPDQVSVRGEAQGVNLFLHVGVEGGGRANYPYGLRRRVS